MVILEYNTVYSTRPYVTATSISCDSARREKGNEKMTTVETKNERKSLWEVWTYDVWGNATDGYEVNDRCKIASTHELIEHETVYNPGTSQKFSCWSPNDSDIIDALGLVNDTELEIDVDGDDDYIYVNLSDDGYPLGELIRVDSLGRKV